jgi:hypothetical protein
MGADIESTETFISRNIDETLVFTESEQVSEEAEKVVEAMISYRNFEGDGDTDKEDI